MNTITTPDEAADLAPGQWVWDADGTPLCLVDTHLGWPQRMWMSLDGNGYVAIDTATYPLTLAEIDESEHACQHRRTQECGHCTRCGRVVTEPRPLHFDPRHLDHLRAALTAESRKDTN